jgi:hypothetical protein
MHRLSLALALMLATGAAASANDTFKQLAGKWRGGGTLDFSNGSHERVNCRAAYDVLKGGSNLQLTIRCASESYRIDLLGSAQESNGRVTGTWSEASRNVGGQLSGTAQGNSLRVVASSPVFSASLGLTTQGSKQSVTIRSQDPQSQIRGATLSLSR